MLISQSLKSWSSLLPFVITVGMALNSFVSITAALLVGQSNPVDLAKSARQPLFYTNAFFL